MNCKPGDLAYIVGGFPENFGAVVEVMGSEPDRSVKHGFVVWEVKFSGQLRGRCRTAKGLGAIPDRYLRPISGVPLTDDMTDEVVV
ncbi:hypothetical protein ACVCIH_17740 [Burkholderia glumae]|uniref:hypothetical protein n=1 Tax=Burkholderia glumae TaxID=337 RepID=UPI002037238A|nr:hypothetical protein [Burkholderia glumae]MCM2493294.1 hypothetical protein [Burkholderia glumae]